MSWIIRPPVELIFTLEGLGVLAVLAAITILWGRSAKRERIMVDSRPGSQDYPRGGADEMLRSPPIRKGRSARAPQSEPQSTPRNGT